jgi:hypothetical protein
MFTIDKMRGWGIYPVDQSWKTGFFVRNLSDAQVLADSKMVECDGLCAMDKPETFVEGDGAHIMGTNGANITTFSLRTECILSDGNKLGTNSLNPVLQCLRGKSRLISKKI